MSTAIHLDRALILFDDGSGGADTAVVINEAETADDGDARAHDASQPSDHQDGGSMPRPLWIDV